MIECSHRCPFCLVCVLLVIIAPVFITAGCEKTDNESSYIVEVENGLLPPVLIEGEKPYSLADRMSHYKVPGVSIAVIRDFELDWVRHYGSRDVQLGEPVTDSTIFGVGSLSKAAAAATILHLVHEGRFNLDDNINDHLTSWKVPENEFTAKSPVTIRRLLNHCGGFMPSPPHSYTREQMPTLIQYLSGEPSLNVPPARIGYVPGTTFVYSNAGFSALQILAEDVTGEHYPDFARRVLFEPLNMEYATFEQPLPLNTELYAAAGHKPGGEVQEIKRYAYPSLTAGGLWCTAAEYARFIIEIQRTLKGESDLVMSQDLARQMVSPQEASEYGLGVFMRYTDEVTYFSHIGDLRGFVAGFSAHPTEGYGAVVMTNSGNGIGLVREIISGIAHVYEWQSYVSKPHARYHLDAETMAAYAGRYRLDFDNVCRVYENNGHLFYSTAGVDDFRLYPISKDTLVSKDRLGQLVFSTDSDANVLSCTPHFSDNIGRLPAREVKADRMEAGEQTPLEMLLSGELDKALASYRERKRVLPDDPNVGERRFNTLGYQLLNQNRIDGALAIFELNVSLYPESGNTWDSYGEALLAAGDRKGALSSYKKALELDPTNGNAAGWMEKLQSGE